MSIFKTCVYIKMKNMRQRGIEPRSTAWKATMLTITPLTLVVKYTYNITYQVNIFIYTCS